MFLISSIISTATHLIVAFFLNKLLKFYGIITDKEFITVYFITLSLLYKSKIDKFWINLITDPVNFSSQLLIEGTKRRNLYVKKSSNKTN